MLLQGKRAVDYANITTMSGLNNSMYRSIYPMQKFEIPVIRENKLKWTLFLTHTVYSKLWDQTKLLLTSEVPFIVALDKKGVQHTTSLLSDENGAMNEKFQLRIQEKV